MSKTPKNTKKITYIYSLNDPDIDEIRYIGKTVKPLQHRLQSHIYAVKKENNHRTRWINSILKRGKKTCYKVYRSM